MVDISINIMPLFGALICLGLIYFGIGVIILWQIYDPDTYGRVVLVFFLALLWPIPAIMHICFYIADMSIWNRKIR
jgi:hypothetical protein